MHCIGYTDVTINHIQTNHENRTGKRGQKIPDSRHKGKPLQGVRNQGSGIHHLGHTLTGYRLEGSGKSIGQDQDRPDRLNLGKNPWESKGNPDQEKPLSATFLRLSALIPVIAASTENDPSALFCKTREEKIYD